MSAPNTTTSSAAAGPAALKSLLLLAVGVGAGYLACYYVKVGPAVAHAGNLESGVRSLQGELDAERMKVQESEAAAEKLRSGATAATKERETMLVDLQTSREKEANLEKELSSCQEVFESKVAALVKAMLDLDGLRERCRMMEEQRDVAVRAMEALRQATASPELAPLEHGWRGTPSTLSKRAQSAEVHEALAPLLARGTYQPFRDPTDEAMPFSLRAIAESGALDRVNPESLHTLWSIVTSRDNDRAEKWPTSWAPLDAPGGLETWFRLQEHDAIPVLDRAQRFLIELGPTLVELRMLAP